MDSERSDNRTKWEPFIIPANKAASPLFEDLCRGLARVIRRLPPAHHVDLSPDRLANFYAACGDNRDELFRHTGDNGLSFMYRTLGCFHSLQPTRNAYEAPCIPCLSDDGFVRWQTLQLLLCPQEHALIMQRAVEIYDIPKRGGGYFSKSIPIECFPPRPDPDMEKWHRLVTSQMNEDYARRLKYSPYQSPQPEPANGSGEYFSRTPAAGRKSGSRTRPSAGDEDLARPDQARRRSSVPNVLSPGGTPIYPDEREPAHKIRSHSSNRTTGSGQRPRASTGAPVYHYPPPEPRPPYSAPSNRHGSRESIERDRRREQRHSRNYSSSSRRPSSSGSSIDANYPPRKSRPSEEEKPRRSRWNSSLMPSFLRRHSSDGRVPTVRKDQGRSPRRPESIRPYRNELPPDPYLGRSPNRMSTHSRSGSRFTEPEPQPPPSRGDDPAYATPPSSYRYSEPQVGSYIPPHIAPNGRMPNTPYGSQNSPVGPPKAQGPSFEASFTNPDARRYGMPLRVSTIGNGNGNGRRYMSPENRSAVEPRSIRRDRAASMRNPATASAM